MTLPLISTQIKPLDQEPIHFGISIGVGVKLEIILPQPSLRRVPTRDIFKIWVIYLYFRFNGVKQGWVRRL